MSLNMLFDVDRIHFGSCFPCSLFHHSEFAEIRTESALYVDKTTRIAEMLGAASSKAIASRPIGCTAKPAAEFRLTLLQFQHDNFF